MRCDPTHASCPVGTFCNLEATMGVGFGMTVDLLRRFSHDCPWSCWPPSTAGLFAERCGLSRVFALGARRRVAAASFFRKKMAGAPPFDFDTSRRLALLLEVVGLQLLLLDGMAGI